MRNGTLGSTFLTKAKNEYLASLEKDRVFYKEHYPQISPKFVDTLYDNKREAVVNFYFTLMDRL